ncbi:MAG TPA: hypothetical protein VNM41_01025, partial [Solirubrobacterales bacterium]|nr:hypothetical protein [Solirubrobacterales bacterium]
LWGARLSPERDNPNRMVNELAMITSTYLDGAGVFAWQENSSGDGYERVVLPNMPSVETIDDALWRVESEINQAVSSGALQQEHESSAPMDPDQLADDLTDV